MSSNEISMYRGNDKTVSLTVKRKSTGTAYNLAGCTVTMYVKKDIDDLDSEAVITKVGVLTQPANGIVEFYLVPADTNNITELEDNVVYPVDFEVLTSGSKVFTVLRTAFIILQK
jgi:hypothetical protein